MEKKKNSQLVWYSFVCSVVYSICFFRNNTGIAHILFAGFMTFFFGWYIKNNKKRKMNVWDYTYGALLVFLSIIPAYTDNATITILGKLLFVIIITKWAIHIAYGVEKIGFLISIFSLLEFAVESFIQIFGIFSPIKKEQNTNYYYRQVHPVNTGTNHMNQPDDSNTNYVYPPQFVSSPNYDNNTNHPVSMGDDYEKSNQPGNENVNSNLAEPIPNFEKMEKENREELTKIDEAKNGRTDYKNQIFIGLIISIPVLVIVLSLLTKADAMFGEVLSELLLGIDSIADIISWLFFALFAFLGAYGCGRALMLRRVHISERNVKKAGAVTGVTFATVFTVVYILFCTVQIITMATNGRILPEGYTYAKYARTGFFELITVCVINICMVIVCRIKFQANQVLKVLLTVISICTYFIGGSSAYRLMLYIEKYRLTFSRVFAFWVLFAVALNMVVVIIFIYRDNIKLYEYLLVLTTILFLILAAIRPDRIIMSYNIDKYGTGKSDKVYLLYDVSLDGADLLIDSEMRQGGDKISQADKEQYCRGIVRWYEENYKGDIRKFNYSRYCAYVKAKEFLND
ncbi:MAG: DUF4173 domain-containing protein [Lachnospiraceae bacterium]|nr:DUF4173 domain-containing protein [Lachnospiraceae bacterium]